ncbi:TPA: restriction endonuclease subunit S [Klebsiella pneumoniae]|nr:restriction endonuclease subunit S [Klebsiella pneumoniae]HDK7080612.1 restriction endonuclease subunit S [Klebsiella pneumoniae]
MVPKLRFEGFNKNWAVKKLENVFSFKNGLNASKEMYGKGIKFINVLDIINNEKITFDVIQESVEATNEQISAYQVRQGDIVFQRSSETRDEVGQANVYADSETVLFGGFVIRARPLININSTFLNFQLKTDALRKDITQRSGGSTRYNIGQDSLGKVTAFFPEIREQEKIANFLSSVDEKMALLNKQYELLCQYKKGLMQKIFSQEVRFKDKNGRGFPKWTMRIFSDFFTIGSSKRVLQDDWVNEGVPFYRTRELVSLSKKKKFKSEIFITEDNYTYLKDKYGVPAVGDFLVSGVGTLGVIYQVKNDNPFYFKDGNVLWFKKNNEISSNFFYHVFNSPKVLRQIVDHAAITTVGTYTIENAKKTKFMCPSLEEQTKIANLLSAMDDKITTKKAELDKLKSWKQGLLQQMFV